MVVCTQFLQSFPVTDFVCFPRYCVPFASIKSSLSSTPFSEKFCVLPAVSNSSSPPPNLLVLNILKEEEEDEDELVETANALPPTHKAPMATTNFFVACVFVFVLFVEPRNNSSSGDGTTGFDSRSSCWCCFLRSEEVSSLNIIFD